ncbi:MAG: hypothetical protein C4526_12520 [Nitrospiraceae bacterium]|nr:MAG: hypothetical protein C4526_12520 [Nitrospiraceae bacterium]
MDISIIKFQKGVLTMSSDVKIYGICLERLKYQIKNARQRLKDNEHVSIELLESYNTRDMEDIIDILELYDIEERTFDALWNKLEELAYTVSVLTTETLLFDLTEEGHIGLYLMVNAPVAGEVHINLTTSRHA